MRAILLLLLLFPLLGAAVNALLGRTLPRRAVEVIACLGVLGAFGAAIAGFAALGGGTMGGPGKPVVLFGWFSVGGLNVAMDARYDALAAVMALMVSGVSSLIHLYSVPFMRDDEGYVRFFTYLNLFVFAMLVITVADNLAFVYLGWEGVGFCSYALIGHWYSDDANADAGRKAFVLTRIGDVAFGVVMALCFARLGTLSITTIVAQAPSLSPTLATGLGLLLLWAAVGKSAQLPLSVWLPDAMAGPTPVSALIHAATMVTAGAYLLMRLFPVLARSPTTLAVVGIVGAATGLYSALAALGQRDIKRVLAYSTMSQISYMFLGLAAGDIVGSLFLLLSHAFFKALLFLCAGCIIQAFHEEHDIFRMGNLRKLLPGVYPQFLIGALSLSAFPLVGGYFAKDRILIATYLQPGPLWKLLWAVGTAGALLTTLYTMRLFFVASRESAEGPKPSDLAPIPKSMGLFLWPLALLSLFDGLLNLPFGPRRWLAHYLSSVPGVVVDLASPPAVEWGFSAGDAVGVLAVIAVAYAFFYRRRSEPGRGPWYQALFAAFYLDRAYVALVARPYAALADLLWGRLDEAGLSRGLFEGLGRSLAGASGLLGLWTTGRLSAYLKMLLLGCAVLLGAFALGR